MAKHDLALFRTQTFVSDTDGSPKTYLHDQKLCRALGSSTEMLLHFVGDRRSSSDAVAVIKVYQGADPENRPADVGTLMKEFVVNIDQLRPPPLCITGPYQGKLDVTVEVLEDAAAPTTQQEFQFALYATLMMDS